MNSSCILIYSSTREGNIIIPTGFPSSKSICLLVEGIIGHHQFLLNCTDRYQDENLILQRTTLLRITMSLPVTAPAIKPNRKGRGGRGGCKPSSVSNGESRISYGGTNLFAHFFFKKKKHENHVIAPFQITIYEGRHFD